MVSRQHGPVELPASDPGSSSEGMAPGRPRSAAGIEPRLSRLFGESLFGTWLEPSGLTVSTSGWRRRPRRWLRILSMVGLGAVLVWVLWRPPPAAIQPTTDPRAPLARELLNFLQEGELERASEFGDLLRQGKDLIDARDPHLAAMVESEAMLYRYHDASPARLRRIEPCLAMALPGLSRSLRTLVSLTIRSGRERASALEDLEALRSELAQETEYHHLVATALESRGEIAAAREAWRRSAQLGPLWFPHRFEQALFEQRQGNQEAARRIAQAMARAAPESPWSELGVAWFGESRKQFSDRAGVEVAPGGPPVLRYYAHLLRALELSERQDPVRARQELERAAEAVHGQAPFLMDALEWILSSGQPGLGRALTELESWSRQPGLLRYGAERLMRADRASVPPPARGGSPGRPGVGSERDH